MTSSFEIRYQSRQLGSEQSPFCDSRWQRGRIHLLARGTPAGMTVMFFNREGYGIEIDLLDNPWWFGRRLQGLTTIRAMGQAMRERARDLVSSKGNAEMRRVSRLAADGPIGLVGIGRGLVGLDDVRRGRFRRRGGIFLGRS